MLDVGAMSLTMSMLMSCSCAALTTTTSSIHRGQRQPRRGDLQYSMPLELAVPDEEIEARVEVQSAGVKGMGAFAGERIKAGTWVGRYAGERLTDEQRLLRYKTEPGDYVYKISDDLFVDGQNSTHFSRYFNHAEHRVFSNLDVTVDEDLERIDFFALRDIEAGEELTFDYGIDYWITRPPGPSPNSDSRNFSSGIFREAPPELSLIYPPPPGTVLPLIPLTAAELLAALALPEQQSRQALLRCLDYFGAALRSPSGALEVRFGVDAQAEALVLVGGQDEASHEDLQRAAARCIVEAVLTPADRASGGAVEADGASTLASRFEATLEALQVELSLLRSWRQRVPRFASARHDAVGADH